MTRNVIGFAVCCLVLCGAVSLAHSPEVSPVSRGSHGLTRGRADILFFDDMESGTNGWTTVDETMLESRFHADTYLAYGGAGSSWWCGTFDYDADGGYGNNWREWLDIPATDISGALSPVLTYTYRYDTEYYDVVHVEAQMGGEFSSLVSPYSGNSGGWQDLGTYGPYLGTHDNPIVARFRFWSDGSYSDEDGGYVSVGGACHFDNIKIYDSVTGTEYFFDDIDSGGLCTPGVPPSSGDYWHITDRACPAYSDPHSWWCGDDADTSHIPPNLDNSLLSPVIDVTGVEVCTMRFWLHCEVPLDYTDGDWYSYYFTTDGGVTWQMTGPYYYEEITCDGWIWQSGIDITPYLPGTEFQFKIKMQTDGDGSGPGHAGGAGIYLDDFTLEDWSETGVPDDEEMPSEFALRGNQPNPFNPTTVISYDLPEPTDVRLAVYSVDGRCVAVLKEGRVPGGRRSAAWQGRDTAGNELPSGVYFALLEAGEKTAVHKMVLLK